MAQHRCLPLGAQVALTGVGTRPTLVLKFDQRMLAPGSFFQKRQADREALPNGRLVALHRLTVRPLPLQPNWLRKTYHTYSDRSRGCAVSARVSDCGLGCGVVTCSRFGCCSWCH